MTKEEQKQHLIDLMNRETLEEAAKELYPIEYTGRMFMPTRDELNNSYKQEAFIEGAKWQRENRFTKNQNYDVLTIKTKWSEWTIDGYIDGSVEINHHSEDGGSSSLLLNQEELKEFIKFLQLKVKQ